MQLFNPLREENIPVNELFCRSFLLQELGKVQILMQDAGAV